MDYRKGRTKRYLTNFHIVFCPKYRRQLLIGPVRDDLGLELQRIAQEKGWQILGMEIMPDHVHIFISTDTGTAPQEIVKLLKGRTSRTLRERFWALRRSPALWAPSYILSTAGNVSSETIMRYIQEQWNRWGD
jgi:putative transposase